MCLYIYNIKIQFIHNIFFLYSLNSVMIVIIIFCPCLLRQFESFFNKIFLNFISLSFWLILFCVHNFFSYYSDHGFNDYCVSLSVWSYVYYTWTLPSSSSFSWKTNVARCDMLRAIKWREQLNLPTFFLLYIKNWYIQVFVPICKHFIFCIWIKRINGIIWCRVIISFIYLLYKI